MTDLRLFTKECHFVLGAARAVQFPETPLPEIAFIGRSNVGKSSLINSLLHRKSLVKVSSSPGRTQQINFFNLNEQLMVADLPGYGYAKAPKDHVKKWNALSRNYLANRPNLRRIFVLIDARHGLKENDKTMLRTLDEYGVIYQVVLTKIDKLKKIDIDKVYETLNNEKNQYPAMHPTVLKTSSSKRIGLDELREEILTLMH